VNTNLEQLRQKISDEIFTLNIFEVSLVFRFEEKNPFFFKLGMVSTTDTIYFYVAWRKNRN
jgi:hypothetical protein